MSRLEATKRLQGRVALITGASQGIGAAVAKRYAKEGAHCILVARNTKFLEETDDAIQALGAEPATLVPFDLRKTEQIEELATSIATRFKKLDILVGNAGYLGELSPAGHQDEDLIKDVLTTNLTANFFLIRHFQRLLLQSDAPRALFVTSRVTNAPRAFWSAYGASKAGLDYLVRSWAEEMNDTKLCINLVDPGAVRTKMRATAYPGEDPNAVPLPEDCTDVFVRLAETECSTTGNLFTPQ